jgi:predicted kinase
MRALIDDTPFGNVRSKCKELLAPWLQTTSSGDEEHPKDKSKNRARLSLKFQCLPPQLQLLKDYENVQSICFELCGNEEPHLVKYDFPLALQPLFMTSPYGDITPFTAEASLHHKFYKEDQKAEENKEEELRVDPSDAELLSKTGKILPFTGEEEILALDNKLKRWALRKNKAHRAAHSLPEGYLYNNFVVEGWVLYLLDASGRAIGRDKLYKVKPNDIDGSHFELFDNSLQRLVIEALERIYQAGKPVNEETLRRELDLSPRGWTRFERDIVAFVEGRPNPYKPFPTEGQEGKPERMIIMMGVPGSGKSTIAKRLVEASKGEYVRVNQDEMGTRKKCEMVAKDALKKQKSVIVDRCNFDYQQRHVWIKMAVQFGIRNIDLVWLRIPFEVCKNRVFAREDHPTIPKGESGYNVIDNFARLLTEPMKAEGFTSIYIAESEKDANDVISLFVSDKSE